MTRRNKFLRLLLLCTALPLGAAEFEPTGRYTFFRDEKDAFIEMRLTDKGDGPVPDTVVWRGRTIELPRPAPGAATILRLPVETKLFPGSYTEYLSFDGGKIPVKWRIGPQRRNDMPILLWGFSGDHRALQDLGFNGGTSRLDFRTDFCLAFRKGLPLER